MNLSREGQGSLEELHSPKESCGDRGIKTQILLPLSLQNMLSERAKGKRRALDPVYDELDDLESQASSSAAAAAAGQGDPAHTPEPTFRDLVVRFTEGIPDLTISVDKLDSVRDIKRRVSLHFCEA